jgi:exonuclease III
VWRKTLNICEINQLIERRVMSLKCGGETFVNIYAPSGTANRKERWELLNELSVHILSMEKDKLPVMAGDWNVILAECDTTRYFQTKYCNVLDRVVKSFSYQDFFRYLHPGAWEYTFHRGEHVAQSRLDRVYVPSPPGHQPAVCQTQARDQ